MLAAALVATAAALGGAELVLLDGKVLNGESVRRDGDVYVLMTPAGEVTMPVDLVDKVRLTAEPAPPPPKPDWVPDGPTGIQVGPATVFGEIPEGPTGIQVGPAKTLAGPEVRPPTAEEQTRALGKPAEFQKGVIDSDWTPKSAFDPNEDVLAESRSTWAKAPIDPTWKPTSAFDANEDVLAESRSSWAKAPIDSTWAPTDGFAKKPW